MSLKKNRREIERLITAFEEEANKFHDIDFSLLYIYKGDELSSRKFAPQNHVVMLWQHFGELASDGVNSFVDNLKASDLKWGIRGAEVSCFALIEGESCKRFVRMATRAGSVLSKKEKGTVQSRVIKEIQDESVKNNNKKVASTTNSSNLSVWLNYLLYHVSKTYPEVDSYTRIEPDPFTLSLLALEELLEEPKIKKVDKSTQKIGDINFKVSLSFPGEKRIFVSNVVKHLRKKLGVDELFYDYDYQSQLAQPNLDSLLQGIYRERSDLVVVFLCKEYDQKEWCGLEWRAVKDLIKCKESNKIMLIRFDNFEIDGLLSIDGYIDANRYSEKEVSKFIIERLDVSK